MTVSKRLRYEILTRDAYTCRYCGAKAPNVELVIYHVVPVALGGRDEPTNLVTSCTACNLGKGAQSPDSEFVDQVSEDAERWALALEQAAENMAHERDAAAYYLDAFSSTWPGYYTLPTDWHTSVLKFHAAGLPADLMVDAARSALGNKRVAGGAAKFRYFAGICWSRIREMQDRAARIIEEQETP